MKKESIGFQEVIGWFGRWTPQFKTYIAQTTRQVESLQMKEFCQQSFVLFRQVLFRLSQVTPGAHRAKVAHELIDSEINAVDRSRTSCKKGCHACCHTEKQITGDEAELLVSEISKMSPESSQRVLNSIYQDKSYGCPFLNESGECGVYQSRPAVCRKLYVSSPKSLCETMGEDVRVELFLLPEIITSAAMSLPDQSIDSMKPLLKVKLDQALERSNEKKGDVINWDFSSENDEVIEKLV